VSTEGRRHPRNELNDLTGTEWIKFTKTWFHLGCDGQVAADHTDTSWMVVDSRRYHRNRAAELHPARYPEELVHQFLGFFTKPGAWVLDPFAGSGATLVACREAGRHSVGLELSGRYARVAQERLAGAGAADADPTAQVVCADARLAAAPGFWREQRVPGLEVGPDGLPRFHLLMTSPPYWDMLGHSRGGVESTHQRRAKRDLDTVYSADPRDLGNIRDYDEFIEALGGIFDPLGGLLRPESYLVVVAQNLRAPTGEVKPLAWDLTRRLSQTYLFQGERIWCQNSKRLGIWGYPRTFVPNYHHHYCLIFRHSARREG